MEKKALINYVKKYLKEKGFDVSRKDYYGPMCVYERSDIYIVVWLNRSSLYNVQYFELSYIFKEISKKDFDNRVTEDYATYAVTRMTYFRPEEYTEETLEAKLDDVYRKVIGPIIEGGLDYICSQKKYLVEYLSEYRKEALDYLDNYKKSRKKIIKQVRKQARQNK